MQVANRKQMCILTTMKLQTWKQKEQKKEKKNLTKFTS